MNEETPRIKVLLVDDQPLFVHSLADVIRSRASDIEIIGIVEDGEKAILFLENLEPDIIIMDIKMPVMNGVEATKVISVKFPEIKIMMLTTFDEDEYVIEALNHGAKGYLLKNILPEEVIIAIRALYAGVNQISPTIVARLAKKILADSQRTAQTKTVTLPKWFLELTRLEREVLRYLVKGLSNKEIADSENLAEQTVKNYLSNIYGKMGVHKRSQAVKLYMEKRIYEYSE